VLEKKKNVSWDLKCVCRALCYYTRNHYMYDFTNWNVNTYWRCAVTVCCIIL